MASVRGLTLEQKIGQLLCGRLSNDSVESDVADGRLGSVYGLLADRGTARAAAEYLNHLQGLAAVPLFVVGEQEQGSHLNVAGGTELGAYMAVGATRSRELAYAFGKINTAEGRAVGYRWISCPTVDVNIAPENPIINTRSLGEDPAMVAELGSETCRAVVENGGLTCVCHFPGHGATTRDSHLALPVVDRSERELAEVELAPYRVAIPRGWMNCIMTAHNIYPAWDPRLPATLSRRIITGLLRQEMGYRGLVATDGMGMKAIADNFPAGEAAVLAVEAGCDILLVNDRVQTTEALLRAVASGRLPVDSVDAAVARVLAAKQSIALAGGATVDLERVDEVVGCAEHRALARRLAREAVTLLKGRGLPLPAGARVTVVVSSPEEQFATASREVLPGSVVVALGETDSVPAAAERCRGTEAVVVGLRAVARAYDEASARGDSRMRELVGRLAHVARHLSVVVLGNPYIVGELPEPHALICTYTDGAEACRAALEVLTGALAPTGRLPITISPSYPYGFGLHARRES